MKKIKFKRKAQYKIKKYIDLYSLYYENLYEDCGIWNEPQILDSYKKEANKRHRSIIETIEQCLSNDIISYPNNEAFIRWKTKVIIINFSETKDLRIIEDLEIR